MPLYNVFGLRLWIDQPVVELSHIANDPSLLVDGGLVDVQVDCQRDWQVQLSGSPLQEVVYTSHEQMENGAPALQVYLEGGAAFYHLVYGDGVEFFVGRDGRRIGVMWPPGATFTDALPYFLGPVLGLVSRLRGQVCLHASAVAVDGQAALLVGPMGAGKSSTALAFAQLGAALLSDDVSVLIDTGGVFVVQPGYPGLRLWPETAQALLGQHVELPRIVPAWDKRRVDLDAAGLRFQPHPTPIAAIYLLNERSDESSAPSIANLAPGAALLRLVANGYVRYLLNREMRTQEFDFLCRVVQRVPVRQATPHADLSRLPELCRIILSDLALI